jgi:glycosyltransferase involved in cell wall biosynthesis
VSLVTIIALCHNHAPFLRQALDSILAQDYPHLEVWLVDDASQDGSPAILREYAQAHPEWHLLLLPQNLRNCRAFNQAFFQSKGDYVLDFATDDVLLPHRISQQVALFERLGPSYGIPMAGVGCCLGRPAAGCWPMCWAAISSARPLCLCAARYWPT